MTVLCDLACGMPFRGLLTHCSFFIACLLACLICLPALLTIACDLTVDRPVPSFVLNHHGPGSPSWAPPGSPSDALQLKVLFLAATAIELALLLGYGRSQYTGIWSNVINTTPPSRPSMRTRGSSCVGTKGEGARRGKRVRRNGMRSPSSCPQLRR